MDNEFMDISNSWKLQLGYAVGHVLNDVCASLWFTYFLVFFHLVLEFTATQSGNLMLIGQVVDAIATPFVGYHSDHTDNLISARYGKRKIWHLFGAICVVSSFPFIFSECIGCSTTHKWAQMYYFAAFILIFQIGWAALQISHLSLIPELSEDDHTRAHLTAVRFGFSVFSNLFVYVVTWAVLHVYGAADKQIGPDDSWKFRHVVYIVLSVGILTTAWFHLVVSEKSTLRHQEQLLEQDSSRTHCDFLRTPLLYQVAGIYMCTRLGVNVFQVLMPLYLHLTLGLTAKSLALIPLALYLGSLGAAGVQRLTPRSVTRKINYFVGCVCALTGFVWIYFGSAADTTYTVYLIYLVAVLVGFGGAVMMVTSLALAADLVGVRTEASAFVYGLMSFTDKLACGIAIAIIQMYADGAGSSYYRDALSWVCCVATVLGLALTFLLPKFTTNSHSLLINDSTSINQAEEERIGPD